MTVQWSNRDYKDGGRMDEFKDKLKRLRKEKEPGKSAVIVSQLMGLGQNTLRGYEKGEHEPTLSNLAIIAKYYNISLGYFDEG